MAVKVYGVADEQHVLQQFDASSDIMADAGCNRAASFALRDSWARGASRNVLMSVSRASGLRALCSIRISKQPNLKLPLTAAPVDEEALKGDLRPDVFDRDDGIVSE